MVRFEFNEDAYRQLLAEIADKIQDTDTGLRAGYTGQPAREIALHARAALAEIGVTLPEEDLLAYCQSITNNEDFKFELQG
jgi:hypothetical protein